MLHATQFMAQRLPPPSWLLALLLLLIPLATINNFFAYHQPGAIGSSMLQAFGLDAQQFGELFTIYSAPNVILVLFGGIWCDRYGVVRMSLLFNVSMLVGMIVFALAPMEPEVDAEGISHASARSMKYLLAGRLLLGLGGECLCAAARSVTRTLRRQPKHDSFATVRH